MFTCTQMEEWVERCIDGTDSLPDEAAAHLLSCDHCREYQGVLEQIAVALQRLDIPAPPPTLVSDVMIYIENQERLRAAVGYVPGVALFQMLWETFSRYLPKIVIPAILQREAWPAALASLAVVWGVLIAPQVEAGKTEQFLNNPVVIEVNKVADTIRSQGERFADHLTALAVGWIKSTTGTLETVKPTP